MARYYKEEDLRDKVKDSANHMDPTCGMDYISRVFTELDELNARGKIYDIEDDSAFRPQAEWVGGEIPKTCSACGNDWDDYIDGGSSVWYTGGLPNYCPNCGARMRTKYEERQ